MTNHSTSFVFVSIGAIGALLVLVGFAFWQREQNMPQVHPLSSGEEIPGVTEEGPVPHSVPPNASRVTATVLKYFVWPPRALENAIPPAPPDQTFYSLTVKILTSEPENSTLDSHAVPGSIYETFSSEMLPADLVGKKIAATLELTGSEDGVRWRISNIQMLP